MIFLNRKVGQSICIGDDITITVVRKCGEGVVALGVQAPRAIAVDRLEVWKAKERAREASREDPIQAG